MNDVSFLELAMGTLNISTNPRLLEIYVDE